MAQNDVFAMLKDLGGEASTREIADALSRKGPRHIKTYHVLTSLRRLRMRGLVEMTRAGSPAQASRWMITKQEAA